MTFENYDFKNRKWLHLPFNGGYLEQDNNPILWQMVIYIINLKTKKMSE